MALLLFPIFSFFPSFLFLFILYLRLFFGFEGLQGLYGGWIYGRRLVGVVPYFWQGRRKGREGMGSKIKYKEWEEEERKKERVNTIYLQSLPGKNAKAGLLSYLLSPSAKIYSFSFQICSVYLTGLNSSIHLSIYVYPSI